MSDRRAKRVGVYTRTSPASWRDDGPTQEDRCLDECERKGWESVGTYHDLDREGGEEHRPELERLLADAESRQFDIVLVWSHERLTGRTVDLEQTLATLDAFGVEFHDVFNGIGQVTLASVRAEREWLAEVSRRVEETPSRASREVQQQLARDGRVGNGGPRPFGFEADRRTVRASEARLIREAAEQILGGATSLDIRRSWTARGVATSTGAAWSTTAIRKVLTSPRVAGLRLHPRVGEVEAEWEPILDRETWDRLCELLSDPARRRSSAG